MILHSPRTVTLLLSDAWVGHEATVLVNGWARGEGVAKGTAMAIVKPDELVKISIALEAGCDDGCQMGQARCVGDDVSRCEAGQAGQVGCLVWGIAKPCPIAAPFCSDGVCSAQCEDEAGCDTVGKARCVGSGYALCGAHDSDSCLEWGAPVLCKLDELCVSGACVPACNGGPCPCEDGETQSCEEAGECKRGTRLCEDGTFGACVWAVGPTPEICDGLDNDCNGATDDGLIAPRCTEQRGVCAGATQRCGGFQGWQPCDTADFQGHAMSRGLTYEVTESSCDGHDNDCEGDIDEPASCCKPTCEGKACGADDGCGGACQEGSCPVNESCEQGACGCVDQICDSACCKYGEVCTEGACCTPNCVLRACGDDPVCGSSCGTCFSGDFCAADGDCVTFGTWDRFDSPTNDDVHAIWGTSASDVWFAGDGIYHLREGGWDRYYASGLQGIWGSSSSDVWFVGGSSMTDDGWIFHYDGSDVTKVEVPIGTDLLYGIWGSSASDIWVVGGAPGYSGDVPELLHYDGSSWTRMRDKLPWTSGRVYGIWGNSATNIWIASTRGIGHYDGTNWTESHASSEGYYAIAGAGGEVWAVGYSGALRYDGSWHAEDTGISDTLEGVWLMAPSEVWAVGRSGQIMRYAGGRWHYQISSMSRDYYAIWGQGKTLWAAGEGSYGNISPIFQYVAP
ncbi:MAG: hypothetical protein JRH20_17880 [Deltaproteobacteria bacterium]|nr:hypothetical protein [Deltaproteobacteria bacterium]